MQSERKATLTSAQAQCRLSAAVGWVGPQELLALHAAVHGTPARPCSRASRCLRQRTRVSRSGLLGPRPSAALCDQTTQLQLQLQQLRSASDARRVTLRPRRLGGASSRGILRGLEPNGDGVREPRTSRCHRRAGIACSVCQRCHQVLSRRALRPRSGYLGAIRRCVWCEDSEPAMI